MSHPFPESSFLGSGRRGQCDREKHKAKAQSWAVRAVWAAVCRPRGPVYYHLLPLPMSHTQPLGPPQPRDLVSLRREDRGAKPIHGTNSRVKKPFVLGAWEKHNYRPLCRTGRACQDHTPHVATCVGPARGHR